MNIAQSAIAADTLHATTCWHCAEPLPATPVRVPIDGIERAMCCTGCAGAALWICEAGLGDYYRLRRGEGRKVDIDNDFSAWDRDDVQRQHSRLLASGEREITLVTEGMHCAACAWLIDRALRRQPGVRDVQANAVTGRVILRWQPAQTSLSRVLERLAKLGYSPHLAPDEALEAARRKARNSLLLRLGVAGLGALQAMMFAEALYLDFARQMPDATRDFFRWITAGVSAPVVFYAGWPFIAGMLREWRQRCLGMDTLVAVSILLAWFASVVQTVRGGLHVWFDAAVMFVFLLLTARALEAFARARARARVDLLARAAPALAWRLNTKGEREQVPLTALAPGDTVLVAVGETVPADGTLLVAASLDESLLSGEPLPRARAPGEMALAGSICRSNPIRLRVERTGSETRLSHLLRLVEQAQAQRPRLARIADAIASRFVAVLLLTALATAFVWSRIDPDRAFEITLAVLVVSCPCALSLAIPTALAGAHGVLARLGILGLGSDALETLARTDLIAFDKTGTLSLGQPTIASVETDGGLDAADARAIAAALERDAGHPLARAFAEPDGSAISAHNVRVHPGIGVEGDVDGAHWRLGRADFAGPGPDTADDAVIWLSGERAHARFRLHDPLRPEAAQIIASLHAQGLTTALLSGDAPEPVMSVARTLGTRQHAARLSPEDKLAHIRCWQAQGHVVAMVGDGINDAPVLAGADVAIAIDEGAALAHRSADLVLSGGLTRLPAAFALARKTRRIIRQNLAWAVAYNLLALPAAMLGLVSPWLAALGMATSSLLVTLNALRLQRISA